jgi:glycosyltransferase involved in cell wall biosynthesis
MQAIAEAGCSERALPLGRRRDIDDIMRALDLHVLASGGGEAFPNVVAEAMLSGTPCLVTDVGDAGYMVGETGWVAAPQDSEQLACRMIDAYREWHREPPLWERRKEAARDRIMTNFTIEKMAEEYEAIWASVARRS